MNTAGKNISTSITTDTVEDVETFRGRARTWIRSNLGPGPTGPMLSDDGDDEAELAESDRQRGLQRQLFDAGFAGIVVPKEYGGQGLAPAHAFAFSEEIDGYDYPRMLQVPNMTPCLAVILEFGTHEQKLRHIPPILKGETIWIQFLSEPSGGSDAAGARMTATRDGDEWLLNGEKVWSSGAWRADWGLCLARSNSEVNKHRGLSVFLVPTHAEGIEMSRIEMLNGSKEFCQEYFTDVRVPHSDLVGEADNGWTVGIRWMFHERSFALSPHIIWAPSSGGIAGTSETTLVEAARLSGQIDNPHARDMIGEVRANSLVGKAMSQRIGQAMRTGYLSDQAAAISRLMSGVNRTRLSTVAHELAGNAAVVWDEDDETLGAIGQAFLSRQAAQIGGGTTEMARNVISERVLGMPRERDGSKDVPFRQVPTSPTSR